MYVLLLVLGAVITASGIALVISGVSIQSHTLDVAIVTPGSVAAIGGLILIGLGLAVRVLQRIEHAVAARPYPPNPIAAAASPTAELSSDAIRLAPLTEPQTQVAPPAAVPAPPPAVPVVAPSPAVPVDPTLEQFREAFPTLARRENTPAVAECETVAPAPLTNGHDAGGTHDPAAIKVVPQPAEARARPVAIPPKPKKSAFESFWPKGARADGHDQTAPAQISARSVAEPEQRVEPDVDIQSASPAQPASAVSILKSGVVNGMAYTLYSDGSIEAQLPQATLRFGSITELRDHIERES